MAYDFLNTTTYSKPLQMQEELISQLSGQPQNYAQGTFDDLEEIGDDADLIEIMAQEELEEQQEEQEDKFAYETEEDNDLSTSTDQLIASMLLDEREGDGMGNVGTYHSGTPISSDDAPRRERRPRIWFPQEGEPGVQQYGGYAKKPKYQFGGTLVANTQEEQIVGLNDPTYNNAVLNLSGVNTIRGLDNYQPVAVTDGRKYKILNGPKDTAKFRGKVYEQKL